MKQTFKVLNIVLIIATLIGCAIYHQYGGLWLKALACSGFALLGITNLVYTYNRRVKNKKFPWLIVLGLCTCMTGDVVLNIHFIFGALIFVIGHFFYIAAYGHMIRFGRRDLLMIAMIGTISVLIVAFAPCFHYDSAIMKAVCIFYAVIISCMLGKAISNFLQKQRMLYYLMMQGSILFFFSDLMLALDRFAAAPELASTLCLFTYFPAQCFLAYSLYHYAKLERTA